MTGSSPLSREGSDVAGSRNGPHGPGARESASSARNTGKAKARTVKVRDERMRKAMRTTRCPVSQCSRSDTITKVRVSKTILPSIIPAVRRLAHQRMKGPRMGRPPELGILVGHGPPEEKDLRSVIRRDEDMNAMTALPGCNGHVPRLTARNDPPHGGKAALPPHIGLPYA